MSIWDSVSKGMEIGGALRTRARNEEREQAYGDAFAGGGWGGVEQAAGGMGDLRTAQSAGETRQQDQQSAFQLATRNATVLGNAATSLMGVPYDQRRARIDQMAPLFTQMGFDAAQLQNFDPTDEALTAIRGIQGQFSQFTDIRQQGDAIVGIRPDGSAHVIRQGQPNAPTGHRWVNDGQALERIPGYEPSSMMAQAAPPRAPSGYRYTEDGQSLEAIPGGPAAARVQSAEAKRMGSMLSAMTSNSNVLASIDAADRLSSNAGLGGGTGMNQWTSGIPGTTSHNLNAAVDTIVANIGFDRLSEMRMNSPTGGALGNVTERELALLQAVVASLRTSQNNQEFRRNLSRVRDQYVRSMQAIRAAYEQDFGPMEGGAASVPAGAPEQPATGIDSLTDEQLEALARELGG